MSKNLVIVESPAKAKTIEGYLGEGFVVKSSFGHVRDLPKKGMGIDIENNFQPDYEVTPDKKKVVAELKKLAKAAEVIWLATDEDREGEAISWHLYETLGLTPENTKRITFNEITKIAVQKAVKNPRTIDINLVDAQQARRILDRLVGFELSPVLWRKIKPSLSAGRVQSVAVRIIVERERQIERFAPTSSFKVKGDFILDGKVIQSALSTAFKSEEETTSFLEKCINSSFDIESVETKPSKKTPAAPFTTSTLQQEASRKMGYSVSKTMTLAQRLYEAGKITYMRTDSLNLSDTAREGAKDEIIKAYGQEFSKERKFSTKSKGAQEAHEAIRPTDFGTSSAGSDSGEQRIYDLIWKRAIASQMSDAQLERTTVKIAGSKIKEKFVAKGEVIKFEGFLKVYLEGNDDDEDDDELKDGLLPSMLVGDALIAQTIISTQRFTRPPARYTEASLVKKLEELGIGRPSTYAPTISTVQKRGYVEKVEKAGNEREYTVVSLIDREIKSETKIERYGADKNKLSPTDIGGVVNDFLVENFDKVLDYNFTASVEKQFDDIAAGQLQWNEMIKSFYKPFHDTIEDTMENSERMSGQRELGKTKDGKLVIARIGRFGPMVQVGETSEDEDAEKPKFASLQGEQSITSITLEEAMELFKLPRDLGEYNGEKISVAIGRFGPYVKYGSKFASLKKDEGDDPMTITLERAQAIIDEKVEADKNKYIKTFPENEHVSILNGRYGPYIKIGKKNVKIPKDLTKELVDLTLEECLEIEKNYVPKKRGKK
jgi:DNA topoisomerase-1